ncbi:AMP-binding protein [Amycolatopsis acidiphila]|uniref:AMP-binding protein n=1 Tax=Amycolatopsis acidiphila TaxID=715473 RepID=A0A557ZXS8_9PSEU|nr:AMP-binding protein [Amycolatopsis acidiphila]TVT16812.1 AMP-binding protein [Amycolatopsis acidiphila]UIJ57070.1 AMP-binding protein [Amycolatopsis acidiphila]GHG53533.1 acyl-CoA synthetase [Amycolatopsis acidiphila]
MSFDVTSLDHRRAANRWERVSVGDILERLTWSYPDKEAIVGWRGAFAHPEHERLTYRQADELTARFANGLLARGLRRGDRVLLFCENSVEAYLAKLGIAKAGLVCVPVNPTLAPDVVAHLIETTEPAFAVVDAELWARAKEPFGQTGLAPGVTIPIGGGAVEDSVTFAGFVHEQPTTEPATEISGDDIWQILFTSGTTALPKGAMISHHSSHYAAYSFALTLTRGVRLECDLKLATFLPIIYHVADQIFTFPAFLAGGTLLIGRRPDPAAVAEAISREAITALWAGSPAMAGALAGILREDRLSYDPRSLKVLVYGWAALAPGTLATFKRLCGEELVATEIFGQTESISCHRFWPDKWPEVYRRTAPEQNYVGVPNPLLASTVMDETGAMLTGRPGVPGEAVYRSPAVTAGYYRDLPATEEAFRDGWFHSGDSCVYDEHGLRVMVDRYKDIVKSGGENVSSIRVESVLHQHPGVAEAAVVGLPHDRWGEAVTAVVVPGATGTTTREDLLAFCRERLAGFETPKDVVFVTALPETVGGKVLKYKLRQQYRTFYSG